MGYCRELSSNLSGDEKGWANVTTPNKPLLPLLPLRFKVLLLKIVLNDDAFGDWHYKTPGPPKNAPTANERGTRMKTTVPRPGIPAGMTMRMKKGP